MTRKVVQIALGRSENSDILYALDVDGGIYRGWLNEEAFEWEWESIPSPTVAPTATPSRK
jgi:hypothetical protein